MDVIGDLVARERRTDELAVRTDSRAGSYSYEKYCTNAWKTGNILRHYGVRGGATVAVDAGDSLTPPPLLALFGASLLGAATHFDPGESPSAKALVVPAARADAYDPGPGTKTFVYGDVPDTPEFAHFEAEMWSENPTSPPDRVSPTDIALATAEEEFPHERLLTVAERIVEEYGLDGDDEVAVRAPLAEPGTVAAGVLAPLLAGGTVLVDRESTGTVAVASGDGAGALPEPVAIDPDDVL
ncbi:acetyl-CoA synthetase [Halosimplex rubrum]|uniref:Acetyl-CoA synthetase n=1 Tax=Halosimplex rubrum TaxID=869889 RepID=A0A7D5TEC2_9EURY|nr:acetyl-CoA synthetase [Halosimplex rubrum]QLH79216.1 acetyl-CoA synthetase [Halosimplex rubrum]